jgi:hypothetical protein
MLIATVGGRQERVSVLIMEQHERSTAKHLAGLANQPAGERTIGIHRFAMPINIHDRVGCDRMRRGTPEVRRPGREAIRQRSGGHGGELGDKPFDDPIAVGAPPSGQEAEGIAGVGAEIPGAAEAHRAEEQEGEDQLAKGRGQESRQPRVVGTRGSTGGNQVRQQAGFMGGSGQEQEADAVLPVGRRFGWR